MRLFTKDIDKKLFQQFELGSDLSKQKVIAKIYNPTGRGTWYIVNSDESDPDYLWAIVDLFEVEAGSVSRSELESIKVPPFRLPLERDMYFTPINAAELYRGLSAGKTYAEGGEISIEAQNKDMLINYAEELEHHVEEFEEAAKGAEKVMPWVIAKTERASTDLSDVTHYLASENEKRREYGNGEGEEEYADGGEVKWQDAHYGDNALVVSENKMGVIIKPYGRKFHLRFADGTEKTYDANELKFFKDMDDFDMGGEVEGVDLFEDYENIPEKVQEILDNYADAFEDGDYKGLEKANKALLEIGYTFDYGLDGQAYDLRKVGEKGKSESYARGGKLDVGIYYKTKDGRQARYLGDTNDPEVGTFMNRADGVFKLRYDEIEGKASAFAEGGKMAKGGIIYFDEILPAEKLNELLKSTFNLKQSKLRQNEMVENPTRSSNFYEKILFYPIINDETLAEIQIDIIQPPYKYYYKVSIYKTMGIKGRYLSSIIPEKLYEFYIKAINFSEFEKGFKSAIEKNGTYDFKTDLLIKGDKMAKGGKTASDETVYIEYFNKAKKFAKDKKEFTGQNAYNEAVSWGRKNIGNFNLDMVKFKMASGGMMAKGGIVAIEKKGDKKVATIIHNGNVFFVEYYIENPEIKHIKGDDANTYFSVVDNKYSYGKSDKEYIAVTKKLINAIKNNKVAYYEEGGKMASGGMMADGGELEQIKNIIIRFKSGNGESYIRRVTDLNGKDVDVDKDILQNKYYGYIRENHHNSSSGYGKIIIKNGKVEDYDYESNYAKGGKVKFADKVKSIKASLLERKKVSPKVQKDYGKTYSPKEAEESAKRIVGAMTAKERLMAKKKKRYAQGGTTQNDELNKLNSWEKENLDYIKKKLNDLGYKENNPINKEWKKYLKNVTIVVSKLIKSGLTSNGKYEPKYSFKINKDGDVRAYVLLPMNLIFDDSKNEQEWNENKNKYENKTQYVAYKIGELTNPILGFHLSRENSYENLGSYVGGNI